jgi:hypothetical protein
MKKANKADCIRRAINISSQKDFFKFDKKSYDANKIKKYIQITSPKLFELIKTIQELDKNDFEKYGKKFKHIIYSDVKSSIAGIKLVASVLKAYDMSNVYDSKFNFKINRSRNNDNFALLSSLAVYDKPFPVKLKRTIIKEFNRRPDNIYGENIRFLLIDSAYKEGIDVYDVKYLHLVDDLITPSDEKQAIGRGTRKCGQKGLKFNPELGWPLHVFKYKLIVDENKYGDSDSFMVYIKETDIDLKQLYFAAELEGICRFGAVDYEINKAIHEFGNDKEDDLNSKDIYTKYKKIDLFKQKSLYESLNKNKSGEFKLVEKARFNFGGAKTIVKKQKKPKPESYNKPYLDYNYDEDDEIFFKLKKKADILKGKIAAEKALEDYNSKLEYEKENQQLNDKIKYKKEKEEEIKKKKLIIEKKEEKQPKNLYHELIKYREQLNKRKNVMKKEGKEGFYDEDLGYIGAELKKPLKFIKMRKYIRSYFNKYKWGNLEFKNNCIKTTEEKSDDSDNRIVNLTNSQAFVSSFFNSKSVYKGLLLWHSVGTGKTCSAVAVASNSFEKDGYTIVWVTRHSLKSEIWKNIFDEVCSKTIEEKIKQGMKIPRDDVTGPLKYLDNRWVEPLSYKQFTNLINKKNALYKEMVDRNGKEDPFRKTLIIIDEAHKLFDENVPHQERPDINALKKALHKSYTHSKEDSCKLLLMTATPYTNNPMQLFKLLNLMKENDYFEEDFNKFKDYYLDPETYRFKKDSIKEFLDKISGYISYLNREKDVREFAYPVIYKKEVYYTTSDDFNSPIIRFYKLLLDDISDYITYINLEKGKDIIELLKEIGKNPKKATEVISQEEAIDLCYSKSNKGKLKKEEDSNKVDSIELIKGFIKKMDKNIKDLEKQNKKDAKQIEKEQKAKLKEREKLLKLKAKELAKLEKAKAKAKAK